MRNFIYVIIALLIIAFIVLIWCIFSAVPREPWEDEEQIKYVDDWIRKKSS